jgi:hypothetical protein
MIDSFIPISLAISAIFHMRSPRSARTSGLVRPLEGDVAADWQLAESIDDKHDNRPVADLALCTATTIACHRPYGGS